MMVVGRDGKLSRPFKAYPRDPLSLAAAGSILDSSSAEKYSVFRKRMLEQIHAANGGNPVINNPKMRRITSKSSNQETNNNEVAYDSGSEKLHIQSSPSSGNDKDEAYFERRRKNNAAAKKSRDRRRIKEDEIAIRAAFLERENIELKFELAAARKQLTLYSTGLSASLGER
jgi:protein giant